MNIRNITLELSLKPFKTTSPALARSICTELFRQWQPLCRYADTVSVLLWTADGSEILDYRGNLDDTFEWAKWLGRANQSRRSDWDPQGIGLHSRPYLYMKDPPAFTYAWLRGLVAIIRETGRQTTGKLIRVGETFDPGPEFARSEFKYERHTELALANTMGSGSFACCYAELHADAISYAGFPQGISEGTPFGTFLGRQCQCFLTDLGFDYLWLSNGFGFGLETWALTGAVFDGQRFSSDHCDDIRTKNLQFWDLFRRECPDFPVETRGTNLSTGMDLASDAVPLRDIYRGNYGLEPPPNSPWAALNYDFGLELIGWMSHIAEIPGKTYPFRFYTHDPWWCNSPWLDRYEREPHDIYLPMAVSRIDGEGTARPPSSILFLSADSSYGNMPDQVPNEVIPYVLTGKRDEPDAPGPLLWIYPFDEYHDWTFIENHRIPAVFFGDWFMRGAVNNGLPLNTVISTRTLTALCETTPERFRESVLVSPVPDADSRWETILLRHVEAGGNLLLYGPLKHASNRLLTLFDLEPTTPLTGDFALTHTYRDDSVLQAPAPCRLSHAANLSGGGLAEIPAHRASDTTRITGTATQDDKTRAISAECGLPAWKGGRIAWVRGTVACDPDNLSGHLLVPLDKEVYFPAEVLMRYALQSFGLHIGIEKDMPSQKTPMTCIARHRNGFFFSGFTPDTTTAINFRLPQGAPLLLGLESRLIDNRTRYTMPRAWHRECRVFIDQADDEHVACHEVHAGMVEVRRRIRVSGLSHAILRFYHEPGSENTVQMLRDPHPPYVHGDFILPEKRCDRLGNYLMADGLSGEVMISW